VIVAKKRLSKSSLLWLVRSRSYISVADVRRRFGVEASDEVTPMVGPAGRVYVGLPVGQAKLLEDLWREGKVGLELAPDVRAPVVTGVYGIFRRGEIFTGGFHPHEMRGFAENGHDDEPDDLAPDTTQRADLANRR
jgi:hypothetical protein